MANQGNRYPRNAPYDRSREFAGEQDPARRQWPKDDRFTRQYGARWEDREGYYPERPEDYADTRATDRYADRADGSYDVPVGPGPGRMGSESEDDRRMPYAGNSYRERRHTDDPTAHEPAFWNAPGAYESGRYSDRSNEPANRRGEHRGKGPRDYKRSDERIRDDVHERLAWDDELDASDIEVSVADGEITLSGYVSDRWQKRRAEDCADSVFGVRHVQNNLRVRSSEDQ